MVTIRNIKTILTAVSYTHLDVYKRQLLSQCGLIQRMGHFQLPTIGNIQYVQCLIDAFCQIPKVTEVGPVSYTHLSALWSARTRLSVRCR